MRRSFRKKNLKKYVTRGALIGAATAGVIGAAYGVRTGAEEMRMLYPKAGRWVRTLGAIDGGIQSGFNSSRLAAGGLLGSGIATGIVKGRELVNSTRRRRRQRRRRR